jgi:hypothetical protein
MIVVSSHLPGHVAHEVAYSVFHVGGKQKVHVIAGHDEIIDVDIIFYPAFPEKANILVAVRVEFQKKLTVMTSVRYVVRSSNLKPASSAHIKTPVYIDIINGQYTLEFIKVKFMGS